MTTTYTTTHKGASQSRTSNTMSYVAAVWATKPGVEDVPGVMRWSQTTEAAHSYARTLENKGWACDVEPVEVTHVSKARKVKSTPAEQAEAVKAEVAEIKAAKTAKVAPAKVAKPAKTVKATQTEGPAKISHIGHDHAMTTWGRRQCQRAAGAGRFATVQGAV